MTREQWLRESLDAHTKRPTNSELDRVVRRQLRADFLPPPASRTCPSGRRREGLESALPCRLRRSRRRSAIHVRRDKAALFQWVQGPPGDRSSRKHPEQAWRRRNV